MTYYLRKDYFSCKKLTFEMSKVDLESGFALILLSWIRISISIMNADPDPEAMKFNILLRRLFYRLCVFYDLLPA
jgi:hypothetical protein